MKEFPDLEGAAIIAQLAEEGRQALNDILDVAEVKANEDNSRY